MKNKEGGEGVRPIEITQASEFQYSVEDEKRKFFTSSIRTEFFLFAPIIPVKPDVPRVGVFNPMRGTFLC